MPKQPWMKFDGDAWMSDPHVRLLTPAQRGVLIDMMAMAQSGTYRGYLMSGGVALTDKDIAGTCGMTLEEFTSASNELEKRCRIGSTEDHVWFIPRMVREEEKRLKSSFLGSQGGNPALKGGLNHPLILREEIDKSKRREDKIQIAFDAFWTAYPRKIAKQKAYTAFAGNVDIKAINTIMAALEAHKQSRQWSTDDGKYIPHATTWLNQHRWEDELEPAGQAQAAPAEPDAATEASFAEVNRVLAAQRARERA